MAGRTEYFWLVFAISLAWCQVNCAVDVFEPGPYAVGRLYIPPWGEDPLKPVMAAIPNSPGVYPVVLFLHDFFPVRNYFYWQLLEHVASYGYIVVAPQMYDIAGWDTTQEMKDVGSITGWLDRGGLAEFLPPPLKSLKPDMSKLILAGHGRGAKVAFGVAMGVVPSLSPFPLNYSAIVALDPVDGSLGRQTTPPLLSHAADSFPVMEVPALIVGAGLGPAQYLVMPTCAPADLGHAEFFNESRGPVYYFVATEYGHDDFLDDNVEWVACFLCKCTKPLVPMRRFAAGIVAAFLEKVVHIEPAAFHEVFVAKTTVPVQLATPQYKYVPQYEAVL